MSFSEADSVCAISSLIVSSLMSLTTDGQTKSFKELIVVSM
jgi:hypothetical protein